MPAEPTRELTEHPVGKQRKPMAPPPQVYTADQEQALEGLARLVVQVLNRELDEQRPDLRRRRIKSF